MGEFAVGQSVPRFEDPRLVRGEGRYVGDMALPGMVHGHVLRSPHAHATIRAIDVEKARAAPGVLAVLTGADWEKSGYGDLPVPGGLTRRDGSPLYRPRFPALNKERVRWVGDYVVFVVAETLLQAQDAAELVEVDYKPLPAVTAAADAVATGAPLVFDDCPQNIAFVYLEGNKAAADAGFARADRVIKHRFTINRVTAASMEPRGSLGAYHPADGRYTLYTTLQRPFSFREDLARNVLRVPENKVRVIAGDIGGSFGMKSAVYNEVALVLWAAKVTARPVRWMSSRAEAFLSDAQARDNVTDAELALDRDGNFLAVRVKTLANIGAYLQVGGHSFVTNIGTLAGVYRTPALHADITAVFTNTNPVRPYRGNGRPEAAYVIERLVDLAAAELGMAPSELRRRNMITPDQMPFKSGLVFTYDCGEFEKGMDMALALGDAAGFASRRAEARARGRLRGIGLSSTIEKAASPSFEGAEIRFDRSGAATLYSGTCTHGQGHETTFKQLVCDRLGLDPAEVNYVQGDTDQVFFGEGTGGSRSATIGGSAFVKASEKIVAKAKAIAAHALNVAADDLKFEDGLMSSPRTNRTLTLKDVAKLAANPAKLPKDMEAGLIATAVYNVEADNFPNGCHLCEVEIDPDTGVVEIVRYSVVDDVGTVINPLLVHGQITGGVAQGAGQALMEDIQFDRDGQIVTGSFMDYAMPRASDLCAVAMESNPVPTRTNPLGVKGCGEAGCVGALPAVANAIVDALAEFGVRHIEMPATPERVWRAIKSARQGSARA